jgi:hypothetical protein
LGLAALKLRQQAEVEVKTRTEALQFANAALARRAHSGDPLQDYTPEERNRAKRIYAICKEYYELRLRGGMTAAGAAGAVRSREDLSKKLLDEGRKLVARTLNDWLKKLGGDVKAAKPPKKERIYTLCRDYGKGAATRIMETLLPADFMTYFWEAYLNQNSMLISPAYRTAEERCRRDGIIDMPTEAQVRYWLKSRVNTRVLAKNRQAAEKYQNGLGGYMMRNWNCEVGAVWVGDHRILDIWVKVETPEGDIIAQRPWVTAWMDVKSGYMVATLIYVDAYPNHRKILEALYYGIITNGMRPPLKLLTDNGKDYLTHGALQDARLQPSSQPTRGRNRYRTLVEETFAPVTEHKHSVVKELGIDAELADPHKGRQKPVERRFRDFAQEFDRLWPGFTGNSPATRPDYGETYRGNPDTLPTCDQVIVAFRDWLGKYHARPNESRITGGRAPAELWAERDELTAALTEDELQWAMLMPHNNALQVRRGPSACNVWLHGWPYAGATTEDQLLLREMWEQDIMVKTSWAPPEDETFQWGSRTMPMRAWAFRLDGTFLCDLWAESEIDVWGKSERKRKLLEAAQHRIKAVEKADRDEGNTLRGRTRAHFPARALYPHGKGDVPEIEGGPAVSASLVQGPGKGRAKRLQAGNIDHPTSNIEGGMGERAAVDPAAVAEFAAKLRRARRVNDDDGVEEVTASDLASFQAKLNRARNKEGDDDE